MKIAKKYPSQIVIGAHFGGYSEWESSLLYKGLDNVYFDTSSTLPFLDKTEAVKLFKKSWRRKVFFFGTDFPMWRPKDELERFLSLPLSEKKRKTNDTARKIFEKGFFK
ncbi:MAG: amidohydrolase family protein [Clostridiales bacterium]|nr:MAG: amidohydrolase family protein [Clostridiales bacterium]